MTLPQTIEVQGIRVLTSKQIAESYETSTALIKMNFSNNRKRFIEGKHYISFTGDELKAFKNEVKNIDLVGARASHLYLWTEKGALLHAKSLNTDKAWEVYDYLVDFYFRAKEERKVPVTVDTKVTAPVRKPPMMTVVDVPENPKILAAIKKIQDDLTCMNVFLEHLKRYSSEKAYLNNRSSAAEVMHFLTTDWNVLLDMKPKMIEKLY